MSNNNTISVYKSWLRATALITLVAFTINTLCQDYAFAQRPMISTAKFQDILASTDTFQGKEFSFDKFELPAYLGEVKDSWQPDKQLSTNGPNTQYPIRNTIIHIQDAHCNYGAQHAIADIIKYLHGTYDITDVVLEGGEGKYDFSLFTDIKDMNIREKVTDSFVKDGEVSGAELYVITNPGEIEVRGAEDADLYIANLNVYRELAKQKERINRLLGDLSSILNGLKAEIFTKELIRFDAKYKAYKNNKIDLQTYIKYLISTKCQVPSSNEGDVKYLNINALVQVIGSEGEIDFEKANRERDKIIDILQRDLSKMEAEELVEKVVKFRFNRITNEEFYGYIIHKALCVGVDMAVYPEIEKYRDYIVKYEAMDKEKLFKEMESLENRIRERLAQTPDQKTLLSLSRVFEKMKGMLSLELTSSDHAYYAEHKSDFDIQKFITFINAKTVGANDYSPLPDADMAFLDECVKKMEKFYEYSFKRDEVFLRNTQYTIPNTQYRPHVTVLITGGFHTENLARLMKEKGVSYISITPEFKNEPDYVCPYIKILNGERAAEYEKLLVNVPVSMIAIASPSCESFARAARGDEEIDVFKQVAAARMREEGLAMAEKVPVERVVKKKTKDIEGKNITESETKGPIGGRWPWLVKLLGKKYAWLQVPIEQAFWGLGMIAGYLAGLPALCGLAITGGVFIALHFFGLEKDGRAPPVKDIFKDALIVAAANAVIIGLANLSTHLSFSLSTVIGAVLSGIVHHYFNKNAMDKGKNDDWARAGNELKKIIGIYNAQLGISGWKGFNDELRSQLAAAAYAITRGKAADKLEQAIKEYNRQHRISDWKNLTYADKIKAIRMTSQRAAEVPLPESVDAISKIGKQAHMEKINVVNGRPVSFEVKERKAPIDLEAFEVNLDSIETDLKQYATKENHPLIETVMSVAKRAPPAFFSYKSRVKDLFGFASFPTEDDPQCPKLIAVHSVFKNEPVALFHEICEYLVLSGDMLPALDGRVLTIKLNGIEKRVALGGEASAVASKGPGAAHYLLRALAREIFHREDGAVTQTIQHGQGVWSLLRHFFVKAAVRIYRVIQKARVRWAKDSILKRHKVKTLENIRADRLAFGVEVSGSAVGAGILAGLSEKKLIEVFNEIERDLQVPLLKRLFTINRIKALSILKGLDPETRFKCLINTQKELTLCGDHEITGLFRAMDITEKEDFLKNADKNVREKILLLLDPAEEETAELLNNLEDISFVTQIVARSAGRDKAGTKTLIKYLDKKTVTEMVKRCNKNTAPMLRELLGAERLAGILNSLKDVDIAEIFRAVSLSQEEVKELVNYYDDALIQEIFDMYKQNVPKVLSTMMEFRDLLERDITAEAVNKLKSNAEIAWAILNEIYVIEGGRQAKELADKFNDKTIADILSINRNEGAAIESLASFVPATRLANIVHEMGFNRYRSVIATLEGIKDPGPAVNGLIAEIDKHSRISRTVRDLEKKMAARKKGFISWDKTTHRQRSREIDEIRKISARIVLSTIADASDAAGEKWKPAKIFTQNAVDNGEAAMFLLAASGFDITLNTHEEIFLSTSAAEKILSFLDISPEPSFGTVKKIEIDEFLYKIFSSEVAANKDRMVRVIQQHLKTFCEYRFKDLFKDMRFDRKSEAVNAYCTVNFSLSDLQDIIQIDTVYSPELKVGMVFDGKYRVERMSNLRVQEEGGTSYIYKVRDISKTESKVYRVLKIFKSDKKATFEERQIRENMFDTEGTILLSVRDNEFRKKRLNGLVEIYNLEEKKDKEDLPRRCKYMVLEYIEGENIDEKIQEGLTVEEALDYFIQAAEIIKNFHELVGIHRDITATNVIVTPEGKVKIIDLGLAKPSGLGIVAEARMPMGTLGFVAPEQCANYDNVGEQADVYSLGALLYYMLTGERLVKNEDTDYEESLYVEEEIIPPYKQRGITRKLSDVVMKAVKLDPSNRYATVQDMLDAIREVPQVNKVLREQAKGSALIGKRTKVNRVEGNEAYVTCPSGMEDVLQLKPFDPGTTITRLYGDDDLAYDAANIQTQYDLLTRQIIKIFNSIQKIDRPRFCTFRKDEKNTIGDLFGFTWGNTIAVYELLKLHRVAVFHEIAEYLVKKGLLKLELQGKELVLIKEKGDGKGEIGRIKLERAALVIAQKYIKTKDPHYFIRAFQRQVFGKIDKELSSYIEGKQGVWHIVYKKVRKVLKLLKDRIKDKVRMKGLIALGMVGLGMFGYMIAERIIAKNQKPFMEKRPSYAQVDKRSALERSSGQGIVPVTERGPAENIPQINNVNVDESLQILKGQDPVLRTRYLKLIYHIAKSKELPFDEKVFPYITSSSQIVFQETDWKAIKEVLEDLSGKVTVRDILAAMNVIWQENAAEGGKSVPAGIEVDVLEKYCDKYGVLPQDLFGIWLNETEFDVYARNNSYQGLSQIEEGSAQDMWALLAQEGSETAKNQAYDPDDPTKNMMVTVRFLKKKRDEINRCYSNNELGPYLRGATIIDYNAGGVAMKLDDVLVTRSYFDVQNDKHVVTHYDKNALNDPLFLQKVSDLYPKTENKEYFGKVWGNVTLIENVLERKDRKNASNYMQLFITDEEYKSGETVPKELIEKKREEIKEEIIVDVPGVGGVKFNIDMENLGPYFSKEDFKKLLEEAVRTSSKVRGPDCFKGIDTSKPITIALLDRSQSMFENHKKDNFIGINRILFDKIAKDTKDEGRGTRDEVVRALLMVGITHELRHEAGVGSSPEEEAMLTDEDVRMMRGLVKDQEIFVGVVDVVSKVAQGDFLGKIRTGAKEKISYTEYMVKTILARQGVEYDISAVITNVLEKEGADPSVLLHILSEYVLDEENVFSLYFTLMILQETSHKKAIIDKKSADEALIDIFKQTEERINCELVCILPEEGGDEILELLFEAMLGAVRADLVSGDNAPAGKDAAFGARFNALWNGEAKKEAEKMIIDIKSQVRFPKEKRIVVLPELAPGEEDMLGKTQADMMRERTAFLDRMKAEYGMQNIIIRFYDPSDSKSVEKTLAEAKKDIKGRNDHALIYVPETQFEEIKGETADLKDNVHVVKETSAAPLVKALVATHVILALALMDLKRNHYEKDDVREGLINRIADLVALLGDEKTSGDMRRMNTKENWRDICKKLFETGDMFITIKYSEKLEETLLNVEKVAIAA